MLCKTCQEFGHTAKYCRGNLTCKRCNVMGHELKDCRSVTTQCHHCNGSHITGSRECIEYKYECEIYSLQTNLRIPRGQAKLQFDKENPHYRSMNFTEALTGHRNSESKNNQQHPNATSSNPTRQEPLTTIMPSIETSVQYKSMKSNMHKSTSCDSLQLSSNSSAVYEDDSVATKIMFDSFHSQKNNHQSEIQEDLDIYQAELNERNKIDRKKEQSNKNKPRESSNRRRRRSHGSKSPKQSGERHSNQHKKHRK